MTNEVTALESQPTPEQPVIAVEPTAMPRKSNFDPAPYYINTNRLNNYLPVPARILWFRTDFPNGTIKTEMLERTEAHAMFYCTITTPDGGLSTATGTETKGDFGDFVEKAETKAIGRALANLGYGTLNAHEEFGTDAVATPARPAPSNGSRPRARS